MFERCHFVMFVSLEIPGRLWGSMGHKIQDFGTSGVAFDLGLGDMA